MIQQTFASQDAIITELDNLEKVLNGADTLRESGGEVEKYCSKLISARVQVSQLLQRLQTIQKRLDDIKSIAAK